MAEPRQASRVLVVEDEAMIAELLVDMLTDADYAVVGPYLGFAEALRAAETEMFDAAVVDINLSGRASHPIAEALTRRSLPFVFLTGYGRGARPAGFAKTPIIGKPFESEELLDALTQAMVVSPVP
jgi:DNA-binding response OmpR family regulator